MKIIILFVFSILLLSSCIKNNPDPSWIKINKWQMLANSTLGANEGELTQNFTDAWVYADGQLVGVFELPCKIPILKEGTTKLRILATVHNNGISATKKVYPFVQPYEIEVNLVKNQTVELNPVTKHYNDVDFWIEDFEAGQIDFESDPTSLSSMVLGNDPTILKYGYNYGVINLNPVDSMYAGYSLDAIQFVWPKQGAEIYMEIDYRSTNSLTTGIIEHSPTTIKYHPNVQLNGQDPSNVVWKKIYIDMKEIVSGTPAAEYYKISLLARLNAGGIPRQIIVDNIKVLHF